MMRAVEGEVIVVADAPVRFHTTLNGHDATLTLDARKPYIVTGAIARHLVSQHPVQIVDRDSGFWPRRSLVTHRRSKA